jgi:hypothetical protein
MKQLGFCYIDFRKVGVVWVEKIVGLTSDDTGDAQNRIPCYLNPLLSDFLCALPMMEVGRKFRVGDQTRWNLHFEEDKTSADRFSASRVHQDFKGAQCDRGTGVNDWHPCFVPTPGVFCGTFAAEGFHFVGVFASGNTPGPVNVLFHSRELVKTRHARCDPKVGRLP